MKTMRPLRFLTVLAVLGAASAGCFFLGVRCFTLAEPTAAASVPADAVPQVLDLSLDGIDTIVVKTTSGDVDVRATKARKMTATLPLAGAGVTLRPVRDGHTLTLRAVDTTSEGKDVKHTLHALTKVIHSVATTGEFTTPSAALELELPIDGSLALRVETISGNAKIHYPEIGRVAVTSVSGDVDFLGRDLPLDVVTVSGGVDVGATSSGPVKVLSTSGDVKLGLDALKGDVDVQTTSGEITLKTADNERLPLEASSKSGNVHTGGGASFKADGSLPVPYRVRLRSVSGDIKVTGI